MTQDIDILTAKLVKANGLIENLREIIRHQQITTAQLQAQFTEMRSKRDEAIEALQQQEKMFAEMLQVEATLRQQLEEAQHQLLLVRSEYKLSLQEENARLRRQLQSPDTEPKGLTAECFTGNCHHTRKEKK